MLWFKHQTDAHVDAKIKKLIMRHGAEGYAVYFHSLELIIGDVGQTNMTFELEHDSEIIADNLKIKDATDKDGTEIVNDIIKTIVALGLFEEIEGKIYCLKALKRIDTSQTSNNDFRRMITLAKDNNGTVMMES
jgi:hypothetical protein